MTDPKPLKYVAPSGDEEALTYDPQPVTIYGLETGGSSVESVNGQTGAVTLTASDVDALPDSYSPPAPTWASVTGKPSTFPPETHNHTIAQVTDLSNQLAAITARLDALENPEA